MKKQCLIGCLLMAVLFFQTCKKEEPPPYFFKTSKYAGTYQGNKTGWFVFWSVSKIDTTAILNIDAISDSTILIKQGKNVGGWLVKIDSLGDFGKENFKCKLDSNATLKSSFCGRIRDGKIHMEEFQYYNSAPAYGWHFIWDCN